MAPTELGPVLALRQTEEAARIADERARAAELEGAEALAAAARGRHDALAAERARALSPPTVASRADELQARRRYAERLGRELLEAAAAVATAERAARDATAALEVARHRLRAAERARKAVERLMARRAEAARRERARREEARLEDAAEAVRRVRDA